MSILLYDGMRNEGVASILRVFGVICMIIIGIIGIFSPQVWETIIRIEFDIYMFVQLLFFYFLMFFLWFYYLVSYVKDHII